MTGELKGARKKYKQGKRVENVLVLSRPAMGFLNQVQQ
jgi:hypothetical protein